MLKNEDTNVRTCHVLILTPFVAPIILAPSTDTSETWASEFPFPKLPMLGFHWQQIKE